MPTLTVDAHHAQMTQALQAGNGHQFLNLATPYLCACPGDHHIRLMAIREYLKLHLVQPAKELSEPDPATVTLPSAFASLRQSLAGTPGDVIPWSRHAERYEANLRALAGRGVDVGPIREAWDRRRDAYQLLEDANGVEQVRRRDGQGRWVWFPLLGDHRALDEARPLPEGITATMPEPYLFEGLGLGGYFEKVYRATLDTFLGFSCALVVVEPDPAALAAVFHLRDWKEILTDPRVFLFAGQSWANQLRRAWDEDVELPWPQQVVTLSGPPPSIAQSIVEVVRAAQQKREAEVVRSIADVEARYASRDVGYWAKRFQEALSGQGPPLHILAAVSTHTTFLQYSMRDARRAFEALGHKCAVLTEKTPYGLTGHLTYHDAMRELDPDLFFALDHLRPEFGAIIPQNLPIMTWDQDQLPQVFTKANLQRMAKHDFVVGYSKAPSVALGADPRQFFASYMPTCPEQFGGEPLTDDEVKRYASDFSYVSHASQTPPAFHEQERTAYKDATLTRLLDEMYAIMPAMLEKHQVASRSVVTAILEEGMRRCGIAKLDEELATRLTSWYLWRLGDRLFRHQALEWAADYARRTGGTLRIYGNGWDKHPTLSAFAAGPAANGRELLCVYRASKINLQLMPAGFIHQRALDGLAGGGFFLARTTPNDLRGRTLHRLVARTRELEITNTRELLQCRDETLQTLLRAYVGEWLPRMDPDKDDLLNWLTIAAEFPSPDEAFPHFAEIVFDSASTFAAAADRFLADETRRGQLVDEMRQVVLERFSYQAAMNRFLHAMADYLQEITAHPEREDEITLPSA